MALFHVTFDGLRADSVLNTANLQFVEDAMMETRIADSLSTAGVDALTKLTKTGVLVSGDINLARMVGNVISGDMLGHNTKHIPNVHHAFDLASNVLPFKKPVSSVRPSITGAMHLAA